MSKKLILAEKPAVARDLARVLGVPARGQGAFVGADHVITWCIGHLVELEEPAAYRPEWKRWAWTGLPMLPAQFALRPSQATAQQWRVVRDLLRKREFAAVVNACDAGREGELIFRFCYELSGCKLPIERLWISSLTDQAIATGLAALRSGRDFEALGAAARCRAEADWLVGMNATRAVTLQRRATQDVLCSIGRVQTPTLGLLVRRERQIRDFVPRDYFEVHAELMPLAGEPLNGPESFGAVWQVERVRRLGARALADEVAGRSTAATAQALRGASGARSSAQREAPGSWIGPLVETLESKTVREPPPLLFDLTALQRTANRRFGLSAHRTLQVAQSLYEEHKLITYPRTDSRYLTSDLVPQIGRLLSAVGQAPPYGPLVAPLLAQPIAPPRRVFQDQKAHDHHAIIPTPTPLTAARLAGLDREQRQILDLIVRRFIGAFYPDAQFQQTRVVVRVGDGPPLEKGKAKKKAAPRRGGGGDGPAAGPGDQGDEEDCQVLEAVPPPPDRYEARGRVRLEAGWQEVAGFGEAEARGAGGAGEGTRAGEQATVPTLPLLVEGQRLRGQFRVEEKQTQPPPRYSEATLLSAMESAGRHLSSDELRQEMKDLGLGTPATRAAMIETLLQRGYVERQAKQLCPTPLGMDLIERLPVQSLCSAELTGQWEARLARIARGEEAAAGFMQDIAAYVQEIIAAVRAAPAPPAVPGVAAATPRWGQAGVPGKGRSARGTTRKAGSRARPAAGTARTVPARKRPAAGGAARKAPSRARAAPTLTARTVPARKRPAAGGAARKAPSRTRTPASSPVSTIGATMGARVGQADAPSPREPSPFSRSAGAAAQPAPAGPSALGTQLDPPLRCPRCGDGHLLVGRRGWGCSRWRQGCPLVIPFEILGRRLREADMRAIVTDGCSGSLSFHTGEPTPLRGRLRLAPQGSPAGFVYLDPVPAG